MAKQPKITIKSLSRLTLISLALALSSSSKYSIADYHNFPPPGCIEVVDGLYYDQTECANVHWFEYMLWTANVFGESSEEYKAVFPSESIWGIFKVYYSNNLPFIKLNLNASIRDEVKVGLSVSYRDYPVVGISQEQALNYSKWRSDRVFEMILVVRGIIKHDTAQNAETYFTIKKYFNKELTTVLKDVAVDYYPEYRLPSIEERRKIVQYVDSITTISFEKCRSKKCLDCLRSDHRIWIGINPDSIDQSIESPLKSIYYGCDVLKKLPIYNLRGNVGEWLSEPNISAGGGWIDKKEYFQKQDAISTLEPNAWTGFRNVFEWKKWEGNPPKN